MAFIYELDLNILKMYLQTKNGLSRSRLSKDIVGQTLRHAHIRTTHIGLQTDSGDQKHYHAPSRVVNIVTTVYRPGADPGFWNGGAQVERRRREYRGAVGAEGDGVWGGGVPLPNRGGVWGGGRAPSPENFLIFWLKIVHFSVYSDKNSQFIRPIAGLKKQHVSDR